MTFGSIAKQMRGVASPNLQGWGATTISRYELMLIDVILFVLLEKFQ